jgi:gliding motility-associated-like protein
MFKSICFLMKKRCFFLFFLFSLSLQTFSQSSNCATATQLTLVGGYACVNGTNVGAITDNFLYGSCNAASVNMVWYTYVANGSNNTFTVDPGTMTNAEIVIYQGNCPGGVGAALQTCAVAAGGANINNSWGMTAGTQVWIGIASTTLNDGTFQFCINSQPPAAGAGFTCAQAIPLCSTAAYSYTTMTANSSGQAPSCFGSAPQRDIFLKFTCTQSGVLAWKATPTVASTEFDWALWDITAGCPGTNVCCNYNYGGGSTSGFGMAAQAGTAACNNSALTNNPAKEFNPPANITCGKTYALQISNYDNTNKGFVLTFPGTTAGIGTTSNFGVSPQLVCGASLNAAITNSSTGTCDQKWTFGDGSATYTGGSPGSHNYTTPGTYAITANSSGACPSSFTQFVQLLAPLAATISAVPVSCSGFCNGSANLNDVSGGNGVYSYSWSTGATTSSVSGLCDGIYSVTITNTVCGTSITKTVSVTAPPAISLTVNSNAPFCAGGTLTLTANGASTYTWSGSGLTNATGLAVTTATPATGTYSVTGTSTLGCTSNGTIAVVINPTPTATVSFTNATCSFSNGIVNVTPTNSVSISSITSTSGTVTGQTIIGLGAGSPIITLTSNLGCTFTVSATLTMTPGPSSIAITPTNATCGNNNGSFTFGTPTGGTPSYSYAINNGAFSATSATTGLAPGTYSVTVKDANGCLFTQTTSIVAISTPTAITGGSSPASCAGSMGSYTVTGVSGGVATYSYSIDNGSFLTATVTAGLASGTHSIAVKDANGCTFSTTFTVGVVTPTITASSNASICPGGSASLSASGGLTYTWSPSSSLSSPTGATVTANPTVLTTYTVSGTTISGCVVTKTVTVIINPIPAANLTFTNPTCDLNNGVVFIVPTNSVTISTYTSSLGTVVGQTVTGLPVGSPIITLTSNLGCTFTVSTTLTMTPFPTAITTTTINATCGNNNGTLSFTTSTGVSPYTYTVNGITLATSSTTGLAPGTYSVTVKDANGCLFTQTTSIVAISTPTAITGSSSPASCAGSTGSYTVTGVSGGVATYSYSIDNGSFLTSTVTAGLASGTHSIAVKDANGCTFSTTFTVDVVAGITSATVNASIASCGTANATATVTAILGGVSAYSYSFDGGGFTASSSTTGLPAGSHTVIIIDANTCTLSVTYTVNSLGNPTTSITSFSNVMCFGLSNGSCTVAIPSGGAGAPFIYSMVSPVQTNTVGVFNGLSSGVYSISVADVAGCIATTSVNITQPSQLVIASSSFTNASCFGAANGQISTTVQGGSPSYTYAWFPAQANNSGVINGLAAGSYSLMVTDVNNCPVSSSFTIQQSSALTTTYTSSSARCGNSDGTATINITGGTPSYSVTWNNLPGTPTGSTAVNMPSGNNWIATVTDGQGCVAIQTVIVNVLLSQFTVSGFSVTKCEGETAILTPNIVNQNTGVLYDFVWSNGVTTTSATTSSISVIATIPGPNQYSVSVDDHCMMPLGIAVFTINVNPPPVIDFTATPRVGCTPLTVTLTGTSDGINDTFTWVEFGLTGNPQIVTLTDTGYYQVSLNVTNPSTGCSSNIFKPNYIRVYPLPIASFYADPSKAIIYEATINFINTSQGASGYNWNFGDPSSQNTLNTSTLINPSHTYNYTGEYEVILSVVSQYGCKDTALVMIEVKPDFLVYIPNTFTPDDNGLNDVFFPVGVGINEENYRMDIFDRWGENIFTSESFRKGWDGSVKGNSNLAPQGIYTYKIFVFDLGGKKHSFVGHITVIRESQ